MAGIYCSRYFKIYFDIASAFGMLMHRATSHLSKPILSELLRAKMAHTFFCISSCAPASVSSLTTSALPSWAARWRAVTPSCRYDRGEIFASKLMTSTRCDYTQAQCIEVSNGKNILCDCYNHHNILAQSAKTRQVFSYIVIERGISLSLFTLDV